MFSKKTPFRFALTAALMLSSFALQGKSPVALNDGPAPTPVCDPSNPKCKIPTMNPWDGPAPTPVCDPSNPHCKIPTMNPW